MAHARRCRARRARRDPRRSPPANWSMPTLAAAPTATDVACRSDLLCSAPARQAATGARHVLLTDRRRLQSSLAARRRSTGWQGTPLDALVDRRPAADHVRRARRRAGGRRSTASDWSRRRQPSPTTGVGWPRCWSPLDAVFAELAARRLAQRHALRADRRHPARHPLRLFRPGRARAEADRIYLRNPAARRDGAGRAAAAACGTGTWRAAGCSGRGRCTRCWATSRATPCSPSARSRAHPSRRRRPVRAGHQIAAGEIDHVDQMFRMRHADGHWVWLRARAELVDPRRAGDPPDRHRRRRDRAAPPGAALRDRRHPPARRDRDDLGSLRALGRGQPAGDVQHEVPAGYGLPDARRGARRRARRRSRRRCRLASERRLANADGRDGGATFERQLADGRWLQINERRTQDGGFVSVGTDITQIKRHQERLRRERAPPDGDDRRPPPVAPSSSRQAQRWSSSAGNTCEEKERAEAANRAKSEFLANMSPRAAHAAQRHHRLLRDHADRHVRAARLEQDTTSMSRDIHESGTYLLDVINDILDMSKIEAGQILLDREEIDLGPLIERDDARRHAAGGAEVDHASRPKIADGMTLRPTAARSSRSAQPAVQRREVHRPGRPHPVRARKVAGRGDRCRSRTPASAFPRRR